MEAISWRIKRHGGASTHDWRIDLETTDRLKAERRYEKEVDKLRQGGVRWFAVQEDDARNQSQLSGLRGCEPVGNRGGVNHG